MLSVSSTRSLNDHAKIPMLGLGVWQIANGQPAIQAVRWALEAGYRHIDTASFYKNEESVGEAIRQSGIPRDEIWVTTKLWPTDFIHYQQAFNRSLQKLGLDYIDLYLIHWPVPGVEKRLWKVMEKIYASGSCRAIGVSNYSAHQLKATLEIASIPPAVNQVHCSPFHYNADLYKFCLDHNIAFEAYSPLTRGHNLNDVALVKLSEKYHKSPAQVLIRWALQKDMVVIPKSSQFEHIKQNADVYDFTISPKDMASLDNMTV